jgi:hypothetical protein
MNTASKMVSKHCGTTISHHSPASSKLCRHVDYKAMSLGVASRFIGCFCLRFDDGDGPIKTVSMGKTKIPAQPFALTKGKKKFDPK